MYNRATYYNSGLWGKFLHIVGGKALLMWFMLLIALTSAVYGITDVLWGLEFPFLFFVALIAMTLQWVLATLPLSDRLAAVLGSLFGVEYALLRGGGLQKQVRILVRTVFILIRDLFVWIWGDLVALQTWVSQWYWDEGLIIEGAPVWAVGPEWKRLGILLFDLWADMGEILAQSREWLWALVGGEAAFNPVAATLVWGLLIWGLASWAGWVAHRRHNPLLALLPVSAVLTFVISYTGASAITIVPLLGAGLVMFGMMRQRMRELNWHNRGIEYSEDLWNNLLLSVSLLTLAVVVFAVIVPEFTPRDIADWLNETLYGDVEEPPIEDLADSLGMEQQPQPAQKVPVGPGLGPGLPREHEVGPGPDLSRRRIMAINTGELPPMPDEGFDPTLLELDVPVYRWRSATLDTYTGYGWVTTDTEEIAYEGGVPIVDAETISNTQTLNQRVRRSSGAGNRVHAAGALVSVSENYEVSWRSNGDLFGATTEEEVYEAEALLPVFTEEELRQVEGEYPAWLMERYLQLPDEVPQRVLDLAVELTADVPTVYDKALMIESYLRTFTYTLEVPAPPEGREVADFFLFDLQEGYCDYYATTMIVLARAVGIPARIVFGYANGTYDYVNAEYIVVEADSHAWVEVYFPEYGWIEFEPTAGRPAIARLSGLSEEFEMPTPVSPPRAPEVEASPPWYTRIAYRWLLIAVAVVAGIVFVALSITGVDSAILIAWHDAETMLKRLYHRLQRYADRLRVPSRMSDTAYEFATAFEARLAEIAGPEEPKDGPIALAGRDMRALVDYYVQALYSPRPVDLETRRSAVWMWWKLRWRLWFTWLVYRKVI